MRKSVLETLRQARNEILTPPIQLGSIKLLNKSDELKVKIIDGTLFIEIGTTLLRDSDWREVLLWKLRHELSHIHYCPYDVRTAHQLERTAFEVLKDWKLAHNTFLLFADLMVDLVYLPRISLDLPLHIVHKFRRPPTGMNILLYAIYKRLLKESISDYKLDKLLHSYSGDILEVVFSGRTWMDRQRLIAAIILRLITENPKIRKNIEHSAPLSLSTVEDVKGEGFESMKRVYGGIKNSKEAHAFYENWIKPRYPENPDEIVSNLKKMEKMGLKRHLKKGESKGERGRGEEPPLPTSKSKPLRKIKREELEEAIWRSLWYKSRAENCLVEYFSDSKIMRHTWSEATYPIDWTPEDDIEDLDIDSTLEDGAPIPELNTVMWIKRKTSMGSVMSSESSPSVIIVLDSSRSMMNNFDHAAIAAFILLISARKSGGKTAIINFSTKYLVADWKSSERVKDILLAIKMGEYTILPFHVIASLLERLNERVFINIITDCGWQNIHEALPQLNEIIRQGHKVTIFHLYGWRYDENLTLLDKEGIEIIRITDPTNELNKLALDVASRIYEKSQYTYWFS